MKALDTPVLLRLLRGDEKVRSLIRGFQGEEIATTEWNLLELEGFVRGDARPGRERRRAALEKLRRRLTVIPIDESAHRAASRVRGDPRSPAEMAMFSVLSALESRGCQTFVTTRSTSLGRLRSSVRVETI